MEGWRARGEAVAYDSGGGGGVGVGGGGGGGGAGEGGGVCVCDFLRRLGAMKASRRRAVIWT